MKHKSLRATITVGAVGVALGHLLFPTLAIDTITTVLLILGVLPWLQPLIKSIELPGGLKIELQDVEKVAVQAAEAGLLSDSPVPSVSQPYSFQLVAKTDPNLALAGLRIELERRLDLLARAHGYQGSARGIGNLLRHLNAREVINGAERDVLGELADLLNSAVHGADVDPAAAERALKLGPRILESLEQRAQSRSIKYEGVAELRPTDDHA